MNKEQLLALCVRLGIVANATMTKDEIQALVDAKLNEPVVPITPTQPIATQHASADSIFKTLVSTATASLQAKLLFIAPSKHGVRLIVKRDKVVATEAVYAFKEILEYADVKVGDMLNILAEERTRDGKAYWNVTALAKVE